MSSPNREQVRKPLPVGRLQRLWWMLRPPREAYFLADDRIRLLIHGAETVLLPSDLAGARVDGRDVVLTTRAGAEHRMRSLDDATLLATVLAEWIRRHQVVVAEPEAPPAAGLQSDRLNDLAFFVAQGLMSEADYQAEIRRFS